jgi:hypothetical protein
MKKRSIDVLLLFILVIARVRIDTVAGLVAPRPLELLEKIPLLPAGALRLLEDWLIDPYSLLLITATFACLLAYLLLDWFGDQLGEHKLYRPKLALIYGIVFFTVITQTGVLMYLRHLQGPASFTHDGGVIQTEAASQYMLYGKNPYIEDYTGTPMAEWGTDLKTALYHFPYLPWTFLSAIPFQIASQALFGWYDQRLVYLLLFLIMLWLAPKLTIDPVDKLCLVMILGLNPIMANDVIFGQNDSFVFFWIALLTLGLLRRKWTLAGVSLGLAIASKPTTWFLIPFFFIFLWGDTEQSSDKWKKRFNRLLPIALVAGVLILPFLLWDPGAMFDDVWRWSSGTATTAYQIRGWGFANVVLALQLVQSRLDYFPFWIFEILFGLPLLIALLWRQLATDNSVGAMLYSYALFTFVYLFFSRFLNENYAGYLLTCLALGYYARSNLTTASPSPEGTS